MTGPTTDGLQDRNTSRRMWGLWVFVLGFMAGFLVALVVGDRMGRHNQSQKTEKVTLSPPQEQKEPAPLPEGYAQKEPAHEAVPTHDIEITKAMRDRLLTVDFLDLLQDAELHRFRFEGETKGVKITKIRSGSIYEKAGFKDGDIIEQINGIAVADLEKTPSKAKAELPGAERVIIKVRRADRVITISIRVAGMGND